MTSPSSPVRVRFAPSPTGFFHIGGARTALFNWLYAKHTGGKFILRIEDTDDSRDRPEFLDVILSGLRWLGMDWDEGPEIGGPCGPYFQSQRSEIYHAYLEKLASKDRTYEKDGAIWFRVSNRPAIIHDAIRGDVQRFEEKDFVIVRSNGSPVFHFVNVVDDIEMAISHVIRGEDHLSNSSKHVELFHAFDVTPPIFAHIPLILKTVGSGKMSKRDQGALIENYRKEHFIAEAVRNYLCLLGWSPKDDREILPIGEIIELFDLPAINKNNARFDEKKLRFINGEYVRNLPAERLLAMARPILTAAQLIDQSTDGTFLRNILKICQPKIRNLCDLVDCCTYFLREDFPFNPTAKTKIFAHGDPYGRISDFLTASKTLALYDESTISEIIEQLASERGLKTGDFIHPLRFAVSGQSVGPGIYELLSVLGKDRVEGRLQKFLSRPRD